MSSKSDKPTYSRRDLLQMCGGVAAISTAGTAAAYTYRNTTSPEPEWVSTAPRAYNKPLEKTIREGLLNFPHIVRRAQAGTVVLKPNLVEYDRARSVNTHPAVVAAAIAAFRSVGAKNVVVAEGPGHCRDTEWLLEGSDSGARNHDRVFALRGSESGCDASRETDP